MNTGPITQLEHRLTKLLADCDMDRLALLRVARAAKALVDRHSCRRAKELVDLEAALKEVERLL